jgi:hypothetical protein
MIGNLTNAATGTEMGSLSGAVNVLGVESVANILERESPAVTKDWLASVDLEPDLTTIAMTSEERTSHLPQLLHDLVARLRLNGSKAAISKAAGVYGDLRRKQGYTIAMTVQESRLLQVPIFSMLHKHVRCLDFSTLLPDVAIIADEVDSQLKQQMVCIMAV